MSRGETKRALRALRAEHQERHEYLPPREDESRYCAAMARLLEGRRSVAVELAKHWRALGRAEVRP